MPNANKNKGKQFERDLASSLSTIFGSNFQRIFSSGAFCGGKNFTRIQKLTPSQQLTTIGDIAPPEFLNSYSWEAKFYSEFSFNSLFTENAILDKWIEQNL